MRTNVATLTSGTGWTDIALGPGGTGDTLWANITAFASGAGRADISFGPSGTNRKDEI